MQGEKGSNSALAAAEFFRGEVDIVPCPTFRDLFDAVEQGRAAYGLAPVENSLGGSIHPVWEELFHRRLPVLGEIYYHVRHCLIAHPGAHLDEIRYVYSHEQALAQCQPFLRSLAQLPPEHIIPAYDTAGAVLIIKERGRKDEAAIASAQAARAHDMQVLAENIQSDDHNYTRFLVLAAAAEKSAAACKTTLLFVLPDAGRALPGVLQALTRRHIPIDKIESRKRLGRPWEYIFYLEFSGRAEEENAARALEEIRQQVGEFRLVGSYPASPLP